MKLRNQCPFINQPPATAIRIDNSLTPFRDVFVPSRNRTSSPSTNKLRNRLKDPESEYRYSLTPGYLSITSFSASSTVEQFSTTKGVATSN